MEVASAFPTPTLFRAFEHSSMSRLVGAYFCGLGGAGVGLGDGAGTGPGFGAGAGGDLRTGSGPWSFHPFVISNNPHFTVDTVASFSRPASSWRCATITLLRPL